MFLSARNDSCCGDINPVPAVRALPYSRAVEVVVKK